MSYHASICLGTVGADLTVGAEPENACFNSRPIGHIKYHSYLLDIWNDYISTQINDSDYEQSKYKQRL